MTLYETDSKSEWGAGIPVTTQSMVKTFRECPREAYYKYKLRLRPKLETRQPLERGKWFHALLEERYKGGDWKALHKKLTAKFSQLFDEEKEALGDLPREVPILMKAYDWHYGDPRFSEYDWEVLDAERTLEAMMPNGHLFRGRVDLIVRDEFGIWIVDHKTHKKQPDWNFRMLDEQSPLYIWAARENGIEAQGFIWNYLIVDALKSPRVVNAGNRFYKGDGANADYPTMMAAIKAAGWITDGKFNDSIHPDEAARLKIELKRLKAMRWNPDSPQTSPLFRRDRIEKSDDMIERVLAGFMRTSDRMHDYDFSDPNSIERNIGACKGWMCGFKDLSMADLVTGDSTGIRRSNYKQHDPLAYYEEGK